MKKNRKWYALLAKLAMPRKMLMIMRISFLFMFALLMQVSATSLAQKVVINEKNTTYKELFKEIRKQTGIVTILSNDEIDLNTNLNFEGETFELEQLLEEVTNGTDLTYELIENYIVIRPLNAKEEAELALNQQQPEKITITGIVTDENGEVLPFVAIRIKNTGIGTVTEINGEYNLQFDAQENVVLEVSSLGYKNLEVAYEGQATMNLTLIASTEGLDEVVVVGYGTQKRSEVSSAISSVDGEKLSANIGSNVSFDRGLGGLVKGVKITETSGRPGAGVDINIRGITSPLSDGDNNPLFVIDGVPFQTNPAFTFRDETSYAEVENPLLALNPNDIESIDVLKDASATAIYGSRGANGVIIVKTKKARKGESMSIDLSVSSSFAEPVNTLDYANAEQWRNYDTEVFENTVDFLNSRPDFSPTNLVRDYGYMADLTIDYTDPTLPVTFHGLNEDWLGDAETNWANAVYRDPAMTQQYNMTIRGGTTNSSYLIGAGHTNQEGLLKNEKHKQYNFRTALDTKIKEVLTVGTTINIGSTNYQSGHSGDNSNLNTLLNARPDIAPRDENGNFNRLPGKLYGWYDTFAPNPLAQVTGYDIENKGMTLIGNFYAEAEVVKNFKVRSDVGISRFSTDGNYFLPASIVMPITVGLAKPESGLATSNVVNSNFVSNLTGQYNNTIGKHTYGAMLGVSWDRNSTDRKYFYITGFPDDEILTNITSGDRVTTSSGSRIETGLNSMFSRLSYSYDERFFVTANFRTDRSIKFGPENQRAYFPSVSASWNLANESFLSNYDVVSNLRIRAGIGRTGSNNIGDFEYLQFFNVELRDKGVYKGEQAVGLNPTLPNPEVQWAITDEVNLALDFGFLNNAITGSVDLYHRETTGALMPGLFPRESGATNFTQNFADLTNKGFEIDLGARILKTKDLIWSANVNISKNINTLDKFQADALAPAVSRYYEVGREVNIIRGYKVEKIFQVEDADEIAELNAKAGGFYQESGTAPGDYKYIDLDGDDKITTEDMTYLGSSQADLYGGFSTLVSYKGFELSGYFNFSLGAEAEVISDGSYISPNPANNILSRFTDRWTPENPQAKYPRAVIGDYNRNSRLSDRLVYSTDYLRLKSLMLKYNVPVRWVNTIGLSHASVFVSGSNLWTLTDFPGIDPESTGAAVSTGSVRSNDPYPLAKTWTVGVNVKF